MTAFRTIRTILPALLLAGIFAVSLFIASGMRLEEDVAKIMPASKQLREVSAIYKHSRMLERLTVHVHLTDTLAPPAPDKLVQFAETFLHDLRTRDSSGTIKTVAARISDSLVQNIYSTFLDYLPSFLNEGDYASLDTLMTNEAVARTVERTYKALLSPASVGMRTYVQRDPLSLTPIALRRLQQSQTADSFMTYRGYVLTRNSRHLLIGIASKYPAAETGRNADLLRAVDSSLAFAGQAGNDAVRGEYFGGIAVSACNAAQIKSDVTLTVALSTVLLFVFITAFIRVRWAALLTFLPAIFGAVVALAVLTILRGTVSSIALGVGSILLGIGVDYGLYMLAQARVADSVRDLRRKLAFPIFLCAVTTAAVFLCLMFVKTEALHELGLFMAVSVLAAAVFAIVMLPAMVRRIPASHGDAAPRQIAFVEWFSRHRFDTNVPLLVIIGIATVVLAVTSRTVGFESDLMRMSYLSPQLQEAEQSLKQISSDVLTSVYVISTGTTLEEALQNNERALPVLEQLRREGTVRTFSSMSTVFPSAGVQRERIARWEQYWTPERKARVREQLSRSGRALGFTSAAFAGFTTMTEKKYVPLAPEEMRLRAGVLLDNYLVTADTSTLVINVLKVDGGNRQVIHAAFAGMPNVVVGDNQSVAAHAVRTIKEDFGQLELLSSVAVFLILLIALGRIELGIVAFAPIFISWVWTLGIMGILGLKFTIFNVVVSTLIFGTGVDYCILVMRGLQQEYINGAPALPSLKTGIFYSSATTIIGVGVLLFAGHPALVSIAMVPVVGFLSVVLITFTLEPVAARWIMLDKAERGVPPVTAVTTFWTIFAYAYFLSGCALLSILALLLVPIPRSARTRLKAPFHRLLSGFCRSMIYIMVNVRKTVRNPHREQFTKPAVIIANHQSVLDILLVIMLHPRLVLLTNDWVWNSPFFGRVVQFADFYPVSAGIEGSLDQLAARVREGYSIVVFPEGSRSVDATMERFHRGAFFIAERLQLDILPVLFHGTKDVIRKGEFWVRSGHLTIDILPRIAPGDTTYGATYGERARGMRKYMRGAFAGLSRELETPAYFRDTLIKNYLYKGAVLEWYLRTKLSLEENYAPIERLVPRASAVTDVGCGYGFLAYMLHFTSRARTITGVDIDHHKIALAAHCFSRNPAIVFQCNDIVRHDFQNSDVFIALDVLHYLPMNDQLEVLRRCRQHLNPGGRIIIRTPHNTPGTRQRFTWLTDVAAVTLGHNQRGNNDFAYLSHEQIQAFAETAGLTVDRFSAEMPTTHEIFVLHDGGAGVTA